MWHFVAAAAVIMVLVGGAFGYVRSKVNPINQAIGGSAKQGTTAEQEPATLPVTRRPANRVVSPEDALNPAAAENELVERVLAAIHLEQQREKRLGDSRPVPTTPREPLAPRHLPTGTPLLELQSITRDGDALEAMINGHRLRVGDLVQGYQVVEISARVARLQSDRHSIELRLP